jgi:serine/threonine protein kinase
MKTGTARPSSGILRDEKMFDPTQTQPLSWRMHHGKPMPWEEVPIDPPNRQDPSFDSAPPDRLSERGYRLRARLGHCRVGPVYEAQDELSRISGSQHFAAVTLIDAKIALRHGFAAEFERGATELKSVAHPNIVKLLEYGHERGHYYLVNELLESASLRFVLNDVSALPMEEAVAVLRAVGDALQYLHAKGMVHGNLRPENVLVTFGYEVKLLDIVPTGWLFGPTDALGVPARAPDRRDDVFGLACLAYEMLAGRHPYNGNTAQEAHRAGLEPARIAGMGDRLWRALEHALAVQRDDRTPNVAQFLVEFGVSPAEKLRDVVAAGNELQRAAPAFPPARLPAEAPEFSPRVVAARATPARPARGSLLRTLFLLFALIGIGAAAWYYQEPLRTFGTDLIATVESEMARIQAADERPAAPEAANEPLPQAPAVTDDTPATVVADGTGQAVVTQAPHLAAVDSASQAPVTPAADVPAAAAPALVASAPVEAEAPPTVTVPAAESASSGPNRIAFSQPVLSVREGDVAARIVIRRTGDLSGAPEISWWTADGTAVADRDFADLGARVERFAPGEASRTVFVPLTNDAAPEPARSFTVLLGNAGTAVDELRVDIIDDD